MTLDLERADDFMQRELLQTAAGFFHRSPASTEVHLWIAPDGSVSHWVGTGTPPPLPGDYLGFVVTDAAGQIAALHPAS